MGFPLNHPYVENVWVALVGPTSTLLLRRLPRMWRQETPFRVDVAEFAASLGLSPRVEGRNSQIWHTLDRLAMFGLATPIEDGRVGVFAQIAPLPERRIARLPEWNAQAHERLLGKHLDRVVGGSATAAPTGPVGPTAEVSAKVSARLDRLQHQPRSAALPGLSR